MMHIDPIGCDRASSPHDGRPSSVGVIDGPLSLRVRLPRLAAPGAVANGVVMYTSDTTASLGRLGHQTSILAHRLDKEGDGDRSL